MKLFDLTPRCLECLQDRDETEFYATNRSVCRFCLSRRSSRWLAENPAAAVEYQRRSRLRRYGLSEASYQAMMDRQKWQCPICGCPVGEQSPIDHDHASGATRAVLCPPCNSLLGFARDQTSILRSAIDYLDSHPAVEGPKIQTVELVNVKTAASILGCTPKRVYVLVRRGDLPSRRDGGRVLIHIRDLVNYAHGWS